MNKAPATMNARYNVWANSKLLEAIAPVRSKEYFAHQRLPFRSIHGTLNHIILADKLLYGRLSGGDANTTLAKYWDRPDQELYAQEGAKKTYWEEYLPTREETAKELIVQAKKMVDLVDTLPSSDTKIVYRATDGFMKEKNVGFLVLHAVNHATHHRGQITAVLAQMNQPPPSLDFSICSSCLLHDLISIMSMYLLQAYPNVFVHEKEAICLHSSLKNENELSPAMEIVAKDLINSNIIKEKWKGEEYGARNNSEDIIFHIDRGAATFFGITQFGCHLNGYVRHGPNDFSIWMGLRDKSRSRWPNRWDSIAGGGLPLDISPWDNMLKEAFEEAGLKNISHLMTSVGALSYVNSEPEGLKNNTMYVFDIAMTEDMIPKIQEDEVDHFELWPLDKVFDLIENSPECFKPDICMLLVDFGIRHGILTADNTHQYTKLIQSLHTSPPY
ncbi:hypothetical protein THRCLA_02366 [Thraustotheca clavata]|uniref:Nudix hydrolase domain-containing protein n=1 Tax=Thraustotheca clavata TaxID=74557 RepID=A0A1W0A5E3_9STRA|nr:hypothetical protein THRCLA_02366 [Thraustotheca clavata]